MAVISDARVLDGAKRQYLVLFEETPSLALQRLGSLFVVAPLDGISHRRHGGSLACDVCVVQTSIVF